MVFSFCCFVFFCVHSFRFVPFAFRVVMFVFVVFCCVWFFRVAMIAFVAFISFSVNVLYLLSRCVVLLLRSLFVSLCVFSFWFVCLFSVL